MDNHAPPDALLPVILSSKQSTGDLAEVYNCLEKFPSQTSEFLPSFRDLDHIQEKVEVLRGPQADYLVYPNGHPLAQKEVTFDFAGYITRFDLPGRGIASR